MDVDAGEKEGDGEGIIPLYARKSWLRSTIFFSLDYRFRLRIELVSLQSFVNQI